MAALSAIMTDLLYAAHRELHELANSGLSFDIPDSPAIVVVGQQSAGKSALIEAFVGFRFNSVGVGTKTRCPVTLNLRKDPLVENPRCVVRGAQGVVDIPDSVEDVKAYIDRVNLDLSKQDRFSQDEIMVEITYKDCPHNLTIIDTPGLMSDEKDAKKAEEIRKIVAKKLATQEFIILCLDKAIDPDSTPASARRVVKEQFDATFERTVLVNTQFDLYLRTATDFRDDMLMRPPTMYLPLGGPYFTTVQPSNIKSTITKETRDAFQNEVKIWENKDVQTLNTLAGSNGLSPEVLASMLPRTGASKLLGYLADLQQKRYFDAVPHILTVLTEKLKDCGKKQLQLEASMKGLNTDRLRERALAIMNAFLERLRQIQTNDVIGGIEMSPADFGETLASEEAASAEGAVWPGSSWHTNSLHNFNDRLYGGSQYSRTMDAFRHALSRMECPFVTEEEIVTASGDNGFHSGVDMVDVACTIATLKAVEILSPVIAQLGRRLSHVICHMVPIVYHLLKEHDRCLEGNEDCYKCVLSCFYSYVQKTQTACEEQCKADLLSTTEYVSWTLHNKQDSGLAKVVQELSSTLWDRKLPDESVRKMVTAVFRNIRDHFAMALELKFNVFFGKHIRETFRKELETVMYRSNPEEMFNVAREKERMQKDLDKLKEDTRKVEAVCAKFQVLDRRDLSVLQQAMATAGGPISQQGTIDGQS